jgi:hypothetical protein
MLPEMLSPVLLLWIFSVKMPLESAMQLETGSPRQLETMSPSSSRPCLLVAVADGEYPL